ncbi:1364_t:CDS:2, partial [Racocetra persica]
MDIRISEIKQREKIRTIDMDESIGEWKDRIWDDYLEYKEKPYLPLAYKNFLLVWKKNFVSNEKVSKMPNIMNNCTSVSKVDDGDVDDKEIPECIYHNIMVGHQSICEP